MLYEHYLDLIDDVADLVTQIGAHPDEDVREKLMTLLQRLDLLHREALTRLIDALRANQAGETVDRISNEDPVVRILLGLYSLSDLKIEADADEPAEEQHKSFFPIERLTVHRTE